MAEYDLDALAERAIEDALEILPSVDKLMKRTYHDVMKMIIMAAAPTLEKAFYEWFVAELAERGVMVNPALIDGRDDA